MHLRPRRILVCAALVGTLLAPAAVQAQSNEAEAKIHYQKGVEHYNENAYTAALDELEKAYALSPHYRILYSLALVRAQLSDFVGALRAFQEYEAAAVDESPQRKAEVRERIEALQQKVASVQIKVNVEDAEVYIDDQLKGTSPFDKPIFVNPGKHTFYAKKGGTRSEPKVVTLAAASSTRLAFELDVGSGVTPARPEAGPAKAAGGDGASPLVVVGGIVTGVLAAGAITTGILTLSARSSLEDAQKSPARGDDLADKSDRVSTFALATDIIGGAAIVAGAFTLVMYLRGGKKSEAPASSAWVTATPRGLGLGGRF